MLSLSSNIASQHTQRQLQLSSQTLSRTLERLSSGTRISRPSDDAAGLSIASSLKIDARVINQGVRNVNDGISLLTIADGSLSSLTDIVVRLRELAAQSANGVYCNQQRIAFEKEAQGLTKEYNRIARTTEFNGIKLFDAQRDDLSLQAGTSQSSFNMGGAIGDGTFADYQTANTVLGNPTSVAIQDLNNDGLGDLVVSAQGTFGGFPGGVTQLGNGDGTFRRAVTFLGNNVNAYSLAFADFNGDGAVDIATGMSAANAAGILLGRNDGTFQPVQQYSAGLGAAAVAAADFNGDGKTDVIVANTSTSTVSMLFGNGNGTFTAQQTYSVGTSPTSIAARDLNGDGVVDAVLVDRDDNTLSVLLGNADGTLQARRTYSTGATPRSLTLGDFNGDGISDIATADSADSTLSVLIGRGDGTFQSRVTYADGGGSWTVRSGDFNGDGNADLLASAQTGVFLGNGDGTFRTALTNATAGSLYVGVGDVNGDGVLDAATASFGDPTVSVLIGHAFHGVSALQSFSLASGEDARAAMRYLQVTQEKLVSQRGQIGAFQSRVGYVVNTLQVAANEYQSAESRISDADIAEESATLLRTQILQQAGTAVLAQANRAPALALSLLS